jgi:TldD protein
LKNGAWGFAASNILTLEEIEKIVKQAMVIAEASARVPGRKIVFSNTRSVTAKYRTPVKIHPFKVPLSKKIDLLLAADKAQRISDKIKISQSFYRGFWEEKIFASTEGSYIEQEIIECGAGIEATAIDEQEVQNRSYPNSFRGQSSTAGYEIIKEMNLTENAPRIGSEAVSLLTAKQCPSGKVDIILDGNQLALQVHESCGHAVELDRVLGMEASYAGTSFLTPDKLGKFRYGSEIVNLTADATLPLGLGTFGYDDEGVPAQKTYLVKEGIFTDYLTSRETAVWISEIIPWYQKPSNGTARADSWKVIPLIRMTNVNLEAGGWELKDLIADTKKGIFLSTNKSWSIDDRRLNFQFGTEIAWEIKNGKLGQVFKNATYQGITPQFWGSCDAICNGNHWIIWGTPNCGKGEPVQEAHTGHGASPARFRKIEVGVGKWE